MPSSEPWRIAHIAEFIYRVQPDSVLDIGIGFGKWGALAREYTDIYKRRYVHNDWKTRIDGIEIFDAYSESPLWAVYDRVHIGDAVKVLPSLGSYDLIMAVEVLEHIKREDGLELISGIRAKSKRFLISYSNTNHGIMMGNKYEAHISKWTAADFPGCRLLCERGGVSSVYAGKGDA
jgi:SAM-dependent methyltransferase